MSSFPKPKKPKSHSNSKLARKDLESWLPEDWNCIKNEDDEDSGYEWGEDWKIEIVEDEVVLGAFFSIQSKVLKGKDAINANGIGTEIDVTTINRLFDIPYPVLIHYVHPKTNSSYVMWLDDWMAKQPDLNWRTKENSTVTLRIPLLPENQPDATKVEQIKQHVMMRSFQQGNEKVIDLINRTSKDHRIDVIKNAEGTKFVLNALHVDALPHIILLDDQAIQSGELAMDTGLPTPILGNIGYSNVPPLLMQLMQSFTMVSVIAGVPIDNTKTLTLSLDVIDGARKSLYKIAQINMQMIQHGRKIVKWQGSSHVDGIILSFDTNPEKPELLNLQFNMTQDNDTPVIALNRIKLIQALQKGVSVELRELTLGLSFGESPLQNLQLNIPDSIPESEIELAEILVEIWYKLKKMIVFPERYNERDIRVAQIIRGVLNFGRINAFADFPDKPSGEGEILMNPNMVDTMIREFEESTKKGTENYIFMPIDSLNVELFGQKIDLGQRKVVLAVNSIDEISDQTVTLETGVEATEVKFKFDPSKSFTVYENWCSKEDKKEYFST